MGKFMLGGASIACVVTCKKCEYKASIPVVPLTDHFGRTHQWQDAKPRKCKGCGYDHGIRISVKQTKVRPRRISA